MLCLKIKTAAFASAVFVLLCASTMLHAQNIIGLRFHDAVLQLGPEYEKVVDGPVTKLKYSLQIVDHPGFGVFKEYNQYDFIDGKCEARHTYMPKSHKQDFVDYFNKKFGKHDNLWRGDNCTYIAIRERDDVFELMVWPPVYEDMLDNR